MERRAQVQCVNSSNLGWVCPLLIFAGKIARNRFFVPFLSRFMTIGHSTPAGDGFTISSESHLTDRPFLACPRSSYEVCCQIGLLHCLRFPMTSVHPQSAVTTEPFVSRPIFPALIGTHSIASRRRRRKTLPGT